jgi:hypothetical protein
MGAVGFYVGKTENALAYTKPPKALPAFPMRVIKILRVQPLQKFHLRAMWTRIYIDGVNCMHWWR